ncbi:MAG: diacylglycerol kinase [Clostridia bacterium]|nr:diacylglycerol kinase [Clostridia bacterium]
MKNRNLFNGVNNAVLGLIRAVKSERNIKIELAAAVLVFILSLFFKLSTLELVILVFTVGLVIICELINTAIEASLDAVFGNKRNALVRKAKDVSAGATLVASIMSLFVAYVLFYTKIAHSDLNLFAKLRQTPVYITLICLALVVILTLVIKSFTSHSKALRGGMPSGHSAVAFAIATAVGFLAEDITHGTLIITLAYILAFLVMQSRIEGKIHTTLEALAGALIGIFISMIIFAIFI